MSRKKSKSKKEELKPPTPDIVKKRLIKGGIRRVFRQSIEMRTVLQAARVELPPKTLKDGSLGKKNQIRYRCAICEELFSQKDVAVDHIDPVIPLDKTEESMTIDEMAYRIWCDIDNLQVVCSFPLKKSGGKPSCHKIKTDEENFIRKQLKEGKYKQLSEVTLQQIKTEFKEHLELNERKRLEKEQRKLERQRKREQKASK
jgi:hypothetical protein